MAEPNNYISATRKSFFFNDVKGRMVEKSIVEIQGTFSVKVRDNTFNGINGENAFKYIDKFLEVVGPIKIKGLTQDRFRLSVFPISLAGTVSEWFTKECIGSITTWENMVEKFVQKFYHLSDNNEEEETNEDDDPSETNDVPEIFKIEGNLFDYETPLCKAFNDFNYLLKIDTDLFTFEIQGIKTYDEYESNNHMTGDPEEPWSENGVPYQLCDHICEPYHFKIGNAKWPTYSSDIDGFCNGGELPRMVRVGGMTYFQDHKWYNELADGNLKDETLIFENFHELDHDVLVKLEEYWWKVNTHEVAPNYEASNAGETQDDQGHEEHGDNPTQETSVCKIRRFEMMKYSFNDDEEYIAIKESKYLNHSKDNLHI
ncbi:hypothetical protein Tco_0382636 [Tanacetum coccineum]